MRKISDSLEATVKDSRGCELSQILTIQEEIKKEFADFIHGGGASLTAEAEKDGTDQVDEEMINE